MSVQDNKDNKDNKENKNMRKILSETINKDLIIPKSLLIKMKLYINVDNTNNIPIVLFKNFFIVLFF